MTRKTAAALHEDVCIFMITKVKDFHNRPGVAQRVPGGLVSQNFMKYGT